MTNLLKALPFFARQDTFQWSRAPENDFNSMNIASEPSSFISIPAGAWTDGTTMWASDPNQDKIYAYNLASKVHDPSKDFNNLHIENTFPISIWSDGTHMWVANYDIFGRNRTTPKIFAYDMTTKAHVLAQDFNTLQAVRNLQPSGIWSDGTLMYVTDFGQGRAYTYNMTTKAAVPSSNIVFSANQRAVQGIWGDATTIYTFDTDRDTIGRWRRSDRSWLGSITLPNTQSDMVALRSAISMTGYDNELYIPNRAGLYVFNLDTTTRNRDNEFNTMSMAGNLNPTGIWSNGITMYVADISDDIIYGYNLATKARFPERDIDVRDVGGPRDIWSDGTTMYVCGGTKVYAYNLARKTRDSSKDINDLLTTAIGMSNPHGIWSNGTIMWIADKTFDAKTEKLFAFELSTRRRYPSEDFDSLGFHIVQPNGLWSDNTTMWIAGGSDRGDDWVFAYDMDTKQRTPSKDFTNLPMLGQRNAYGLWSNGNTMWVSNFTRNGAIYAYNYSDTE